MWFTSSSAPAHPARSSYDQDTEILGALESSVRHSNDYPSSTRSNTQPSRHSKSSMDVDDMIEADISRLAQQGRSSYDRDNNNQSNLTYSLPKSPAEVSKTVPNVPRFRYMPTGVPVSRSNPSRNPPQNYYESEDSDEFDSDDSGENERGGRYGSQNVGGFHESLRLATFRGGSESEEEESPAPMPRANLARLPSHSQQEADSLSVDSSNTLREKDSPRPNENLLARPNRPQYKSYSSNGGSTAAAITSDMAGLAESLQVKLDGIGSSSNLAFGGGSSLRMSYEAYEAGDLPFTIQQVTQNLENQLFTFNKIYVEDHDEGDKKKKKKKKRREDDELNAQLSGGATASDLAPYATSITDTSALSPLSRAKALMSMMEGGAPIKVEGKEGGEGGEGDDASAYDSDSDSDSDEDSLDEALAKSEFKKNEQDEKKRRENGEEEDGSYDEQNMATYDNAEGDVRGSNPNFPYISGGGWANVGNNKPDPANTSNAYNKHFYGKSTLLAASDDIVTELEVTIKCMQKRLNCEPLDDPTAKIRLLGETLEEGEGDGKKKKKGGKGKDDKDSLMLAMEEAELGPEFDEWEIDEDGKKTIVVRRRKKVEKEKEEGEGGEGDVDKSANDLNLEEDDLLADDDDVFGATPFGWMPSGSGGYSAGPQDPYMSLVGNKKGGLEGEGEKVGGEEGREEGGEEKKDAFKDAFDRAANTVSMQGDSGSPRAPPLSPRSAQNVAPMGYYGGGGSRVVSTDEVFFRKYEPGVSGSRSPRGGRTSPRVVSTDEVYYKRWRPSSHENANVTTPVYFVTDNDRISGGGDPGLNKPNTNIHSWTYVPRHSTEWELKAHPSDQVDKENEGARENLNSFPSTELKDMKKDRSGRWGGVGGGSSSSRRSNFAGSSILSARKRLEKFKEERVRVAETSFLVPEPPVRERWESAGEDSLPPYEEVFERGRGATVGGGGERGGGGGGGGGGNPRLGEAAARLSAFRKAREERANLLFHTK
ncbi:hypothetical protein TL16_g04088 [Triparma laevis f. inornata]|uniref:Uncharacterized protein n=1 Tax=Triparma laevis f. inornata TaxID=1714386 RepID=A0A9W7E4K5_9STRA|nr:hypothetical protein TL16_g04088 [Triparma laevis f. inornata]